MRTVSFYVFKNFRFKEMYIFQYLSRPTADMG
uniref:Uncharacterized protein n=1 Tax=Anguilla anguilla TaxID=7936 RepID=A0A0E9VCI9_ANGAN